MPVNSIFQPTNNDGVRVRGKERECVFPRWDLLEWQQDMWLDLVAESMFECGWKGARFSV